MKKIRNSLSLLKIEIVLTKSLIAMPIMVPFFNSIGMNQWMIGVSQSLFTIALFLVNIPTGWLADKFSRRLSNAIGDLLTGILFICYSYVNNFGQVVLVETLLGISISLSHGADSGLLKAYSQKLDSSGKTFRKQIASIAFWVPIAQIIAYIIGSYIGAFDVRMAIFVTSIPFFVGFLIGVFIKEEGEKLESKHRNPIRDIVHFTHLTLNGSRQLRWRIFSYVVGSKITHVMIWALTPLLILAKVPLSIVGAGWAMNAASIAIGARLAAKYSGNMPIWKKFLLPSLAVISALFIMSVHLSIFTIWLYSMLGFAQGWVSVTLLPSVQEIAPDNMQAIVVSVAGTISQIVYAALLPIICYAGNIDIRLTMVATIIIFLPMILVTTNKLRNFG